MGWKKSLEQTLHEQDTELRELRKKVGKTGQLPESERLARQALQRTLGQQLSESGLPEATQARLRGRLGATSTNDEIKAAIVEEREYMQKIRAQPRILNLTESRLFESYKLIGLSEKEAGIAAGIDVAVSNISEARQKLANAAKLLGMTDAEASVFSQN